MLSVPVDYAKPDGEVARLAMIRFKATGDKIGSLIINPGGPGESGVEAAATLVGTLPDSVRERFDLVGFDPRGVRELHACGVVQLRRRQRSAARRPAGRLHPGGRRAHREGNQGVRPALRRQDGRGVPGQRRNRQRRQGSRRDARRPRRREADLSGLLVRHPDRGVVRRGLSGQGAGDDPRRGRRPQRRPDRGQHPPGRRIPDRRSTTTPPTVPPRTRTARSAPIPPRPSTSTATWSTRWSKRRSRPGIRAG